MTLDPANPGDKFLWENCQSWCRLFKEINQTLHWLLCHLNSSSSLDIKGWWLNISELSSVEKQGFCLFLFVKNSLCFRSVYYWDMGWKKSLMFHHFPALSSWCEKLASNGIFYGKYIRIQKLSAVCTLQVNVKREMQNSGIYYIMGSQNIKGKIKQIWNTDKLIIE